LVETDIAYCIQSDCYNVLHCVDVIQKEDPENAAKIAEFIEKLVKLKEVNVPFEIVSQCSCCPRYSLSLASYERQQSNVIM